MKGDITHAKHTTFSAPQLRNKGAVKVKRLGSARDLLPHVAAFCRLTAASDGLR